MIGIIVRQIFTSARFIYADWMDLIDYNKYSYRYLVPYFTFTFKIIAPFVKIRDKISVGQ